MIALAAVANAEASTSNPEAGGADPEIEYLLSAVGSSGCIFIRNGTDHSPRNAESHLRMKYRKGERYVANAEQFITRIASASSWTRKPYRVRCPGEPEQGAGEWLQGLLRDHRAANASGQKAP